MNIWFLIASLVFQAPAVASGPRGTVSGRIRSAEGKPLAGISVMVMAGGLRNGRPNLVPLGISIPGTLTRTDPEGGYRLENIPLGRYYILASPASGPNGDVPTLYPGVTRFEDARQIEVRIPKLDDVDFTISHSRVVRVRGRVFNAIAGTPSSTATVNLTGGWLGAFRKTVDANGAFEFNGVPPGEYVIWSAEDSGGRQRVFATQQLTIPDRDVEDIELVFRPPLTVPGRFILEDGAVFPNPGMTPGVTANIVEGTLGTGTSAGMDGSFELGRLGAGLIEGEYWVTVDHLPGDVYVTSMSYGPADLLKETLKLNGPPVSAIAITLRTGTRLQGKVFDGNDQPRSNVSVYLVPSAREGHLVRVQQTDASGTFDIRGVAPGDYVAFALAQTFPGAEQDADFIRQYEGFGTRVTISPDGNPILDLKLLR